MQPDRTLWRHSISLIGLTLVSQFVSLQTRLVYATAELGCPNSPLCAQIAFLGISAMTFLLRKINQKQTPSRKGGTEHIFHFMIMRNTRGA